MIGWMQKHRKYLVVTIWISTIAFVGAGFVGWGAYSFNKSGSSVAKVGDRDISVKDMQLAYSNAYNNINQQLKGTFTREQAKQMKLEQSVLANLINEALMLNYAQELGLEALDSDVKNNIANDKMFQVEGEFNIKQYNRVLRNIGLSPNEYESNLKRSILLNKLNDIINIPPNTKLKDLLASTMFMQDKISVEISQVNPENISATNEELKAFWEPMKNNFQTIKSYDVVSEFIPSANESTTDEELKTFYEESKFNYTDSEGKIKPLENAKDDVLKALKLKKAKKTALRRYLKVKNKEANLTKKENIKENSTIYPIDKLTTANPKDVLKPFKTDNGYTVVQLISVNMPQSMSFEQAKNQVLTLYRVKKAQEMLTKKAQESLKNFNGVDVGYVSNDLNNSIQGLTLQESRYFANKLFDSNKKKGYVLVGNKAVTYSILEQKLLNDNKMKEYNSQLTQMASNLQNSQLQSNLLVELRKRYKIEQYYKGN